mgnify:CR=1 FL=1
MNFCISNIYSMLGVLETALYRLSQSEAQWLPDLYEPEIIKSDSEDWWQNEYLQNVRGKCDRYSPPR